MNETKHGPGGHQCASTNERLAEAVTHLQAVEGNPLLPDEIAMFEMFEREGVATRGSSRLHYSQFKAAGVSPRRNE